MRHLVFLLVTIIRCPIATSNHLVFKAQRPIKAVDEEDRKCRLPKVLRPYQVIQQMAPRRRVSSQPRRLVDTCSITVDAGGNYVTRDEEQARATRDNSTKMHSTKLLSFPVAGGSTTRREVSSSQDLVCDITSGEPGHSVVKMPRCLPGGQSVICLDCCAYPWPGGCRTRRARWICVGRAEENKQSVSKQVRQ